MTPLRIDIHTHILPSSGEEKTLLLYNLPFPGKKMEEKDWNTFPENIFFSAGLHPNLSGTSPEEEEKAFVFLEELLSSRKLLALGECGLDKNSPLPRERQLDRFRKQILLSEKYSLPLILHAVRRWEEVILLRKEYRCRMPWIAHSFRGSHQLAKELERKGIHISFAPVFLEKSMELKEYLVLPHIFLETDESCHKLSHLYRLLAEKWEMKEEELQERINHSFKEVFNAGR